MIKSPLRYPGGKNRAIKTIAPHVPKYDEYREPFLGGGSVFVYHKQKNPKKQYWVNDLYPKLFHFWKQAQENVDGLVAQIQTWKDEYEDGKTLHRYLIDNVDEFDSLKKGAAFFAFNRITFSGTSESGGFSNNAFKKRFTQSSIERVKAVAPLFDDVHITNLDFQEVVEAEGNNVFIFLDPPYYSATKSALYGKNGSMHKGFDHERFAETLRGCTHQWLVTYDDSPFIRDLFSFAHVTEWSLMYGMRNVGNNVHQKEQELFLSNYPLGGSTFLVQKSFDLSLVRDESRT